MADNEELETVDDLLGAYSEGGSGGETVEAVKAILKSPKLNKYIIPFVNNATTEEVGVVKPDGKTAFVDENGTLSVKGGGGGINENTGLPVFNWIGTKAEYEEQNILEEHPDWICYITDDRTNPISADHNLNNLTEAGESHFANPDLSNLSEVGEAKFNNKADTSYVNDALNKKVSKSGDTMTGSLTIQREATENFLLFKRTDFDCNNSETPSADTSLASLIMRDKNGVTFTTISSRIDTSNRIFSRIYAQRKIDGVSKINAFDIGVDANGKPYYNRPQIITDHVSGSSGYRIWSNGYCEQWGYVPPQTTNATFKVTFLKTYKDTSYNITFGTYTSQNSSGNFLVRGLYFSEGDKKVGSFTKFVDPYVGYYWKASGYLASDQY